MSFTVLIPIVFAMAVFMWFVYWSGFHKKGQLAEKLEQEKTLFSGKDWLAVSVITIIYALVAFCGLGNTKAPQSFLEYERANQYALIELEEPTVISGVRYYTGLGTYDYDLQFSLDGINWESQYDEDGSSGMKQQYSELFRWVDASLNQTNKATKFIRIISGGQQSLGEIAIYDSDGELIDAEMLHPAPACENLLDEQDLIPETYTYMNGSYFDEIYHARTAYEHIEKVWPYEITHPPLGKLILAIGIKIFGMTPFGWRFSGTLFGVLMVPVMYILLKKMFAAMAVASCGTIVFAFEFMHFSQTRLATIDSYVTFFILLMYLFMWFWISDPEHKKRWLSLCGISFGLGIASKWSGAYAGVGLALCWLLFWIVNFFKNREFFRKNFLINIAWCLLFFVVVPAVIYYVSYFPYAIAENLESGKMFFSKEYLKIVVDNQKYMWNYHSNLVATHPYSSSWYQWLLDLRPILYYLKDYGDGTKSVIAGFNNPIVSWGGLCAMVAMGMLTFAEKDKRAGFILIAYLANLLPWVFISRLSFAYHYFACSVFLVLAISYLFADLRENVQKWKPAVYGFTLLCVILFIAFYPVLSGVRASVAWDGNFLRWFDSWQF